MLGWLNLVCLATWQAAKGADEIMRTGQVVRTGALALRGQGRGFPLMAMHPLPHVSTLQHTLCHVCAYGNAHSATHMRKAMHTATHRGVQVCRPGKVNALHGR